MKGQGRQEILTHMPAVEPAIERARPVTLKARIARERGPAMLELKVLDAGEGIASEVADTLFEPFITTKTSVGRGMGLTIARHTARNLGGDVKIERTPDGGTAATLTHPI